MYITQFRHFRFAADGTSVDIDRKSSRVSKIEVPTLMREEWCGLITTKNKEPRALVKCLPPLSNTPPEVDKQ